MILRRRVMVGKGGGEVEYVDLGLPSGLLWAQYNIGATVPEGYGEYFSWGNIVGHKADSGYDFSSSNYNNTPGAALTANILPNDIDHDAALVNFGSPWRLPTKENFQELYNNTDSEWTTINGVKGRKFMKKTDHSVFVFFTAAGFSNNTGITNVGSNGVYWSSSWYSASSAYRMFFNGSSVIPQYDDNRYKGFSVRAVRYPEMEYVDLGLPSGIKWATCNLGARQPTDAGLYFSWGNIEGHVGGTYNFRGNYSSSPGNSVNKNIPDYDAEHGTNHDAAIAYLGSPWRMPTKDEFKELYNNTDRAWVTINGVSGCKFMKKTDSSVFVFFPAVGLCAGGDPYNTSRCYYWASSYGNINNRVCASWTESNYNAENWWNPNYGMSIRAVCKI